MERVEVVTVVEARKVAAVEALVAAAKEAAVEVVATKGVVGAAVAGMVERAEVETMAAGADAAGEARVGRTVDSVVTVEEAMEGGAKAAEVRMVEAVGAMVAGVGGRGTVRAAEREVGRAAVAKVAVAKAAVVTGVVTVAAGMAAAVMEEEMVEVVKGAAEVTGTGAAVEMAGAEATVAAEAVNPVEMREGRRVAETVAAEEGMVAAGTEATAAVGIAADLWLPPRR